LRTLATRSQDLTVRANAGGVLSVPQADDMPGRYYKKGELLAYVTGETVPIARVVIPQEAADLVRQDVADVALRIVGRPETTIAGRVVRAVPAGDEYLPSAALSLEGGGEIATDPRDAKGPKALQRMFQVDIQLVDPPELHQFGQRVYVRFAHSSEPLSVQIYRRLRLLFLSRFDV